MDISLGEAIGVTVVVFIIAYVIGYLHGRAAVLKIWQDWKDDRTRGLGRWSDG